MSMVMTIIVMVMTRFWVFNFLLQHKLGHSPNTGDIKMCCIVGLCPTTTMSYDDMVPYFNDPCCDYW